MKPVEYYFPQKFFFTAAHWVAPANLSNVTVKNVHNITNLDDLNDGMMAELMHTFDLYIIVYDDKLFTQKIYDTVSLKLQCIDVPN